jgi:N-acetylmuramoyl-L-alanine amidase
MSAQFDVLIQAGHEGRTSGATGAVGDLGREIDWTPIVANSAMGALQSAGISVLRKSANLGLQDAEKYRAKIAIFIHFDGSDDACASGASVGYPADDVSHDAAQKWKALYESYWPVGSGFKWMGDNFTIDLKQYYGFRRVQGDGAKIVLELGEITCADQAGWLKPRLAWAGQLIAYFVSKQLGGDRVQRPDPLLIV